MINAQNTSREISAEIAVSCSTSTDRAEWDYYVRAHRDGSFFHLSGWLEVAHKAYNFDGLYLTARRGDVLVGVFPLVDVRSPLLGRSLISTAFTIGGGPLADDAIALNALLQAAEEIGVKKRVRYIECRSNFEGNDAWAVKPSTSSVFRLSLPKDEEAALKAIPKRRRADIRKAIKAASENQFIVRHDGDPDVFYELYAASLHRLGTPVFSRKFIYAVIEAFDAETEISAIEYKGKPVGALVTFHYDGVALPYYVGAARNARAIHAFDYLYWNVMRHAVEDGYTTFDFGRSRVGSGAYQYKKLWGIEPEPLSYRVKLIKAAELPDVNANNPKFSLFSKLWPRMPLVLANNIGPLLAPNFP
ncbi:FemAB family PEP-CTERM system-associated protein [Hyphococcus flavus]|uniref:FemAB family PEP-CTERM system-associated protein n=1 Tax=Hyphococcus flavus TaxID=1866326 RepID=A0AAE9ZCL3_9PROT|nr:FemAB family XrtA/PEP-CTERM system-associated protein [Hyphococcus flavus]WDI32011.1 FemAB family PEP-CTERM system-associated protein [Hyphococcus flavus]